MLMLLFMRDHPSDLKLNAYGAPAGEAIPPPAAKADWGLPLRTLASASRVPSFWVLAASFFICGLSTNGLIQTHFISLCGAVDDGAVRSGGHHPVRLPV